MAADSEGKLPLDLASQNKNCTDSLKQALVDRAKDGEEEKEQQAEKEQECTAIVPVPIHPCVVAPAALFDDNAKSDTDEGHTEVNKTLSSELDIPDPSFWERLCCRPVLM